MSKIDLRPLLDMIPANDMTREQWISVGMALKEENYPVSVWDKWSASDTSCNKEGVPRYHPGECERKWNGFNGGSGGRVVTGAYIVELAKQYGWVPGSSARYAGPVPVSTTPAPVRKAQMVKRDLDKLPPPLDTDKRVPEDMPPQDQIRAFLQNVFKPGEHFDLIKKPVWKERTDKPGKWDPLPDKTGIHERDDEIDLACHPQSGVWFRVNPVKFPPVSKGKAIANEDISAFRHVLVECDDWPTEQQIEVYRRLRVPASSITDSGNHSAHALIKINAESGNEYGERVNLLYDILESFGLPLDRANRNSSRMSRMPGFKRGDREQKLLYLDTGLSSFEEWLDFIRDFDRANEATQEKEVSTTLPDALEDIPLPSDSDLPPMPMQEDPIPEDSLEAKKLRHKGKFLREFTGKNRPKEPPVVIDGLLRHGGVMMLSGPSKLGKTFSLIELGLIMAHGDSWLGRKCTRSKVAYLDFEINEESGECRIDDVRDRRNYFDDDAYSDNFYYINFFGDTLTPEELVEYACDVYNNEFRFDVLVVDPIYYVLQGNENDANDVKHLVSHLRKICRQCNCSVVFSHHHSKGGKSGVSAADRASGSGVWARDADCIVDMVELEVSDTVKAALVESGKCTELDTVSGIQLEYVVRYFKTPPRGTGFYIWPLHYVDDDGLLTEARAAIEARAQDAKARNGKKKIDWDKAFDEAYSICEAHCSNTDGVVDPNEFIEAVKQLTGSTSATSIRNAANAAGYSIHFKAHKSKEDPDVIIPPHVDSPY